MSKLSTLVLNFDAEKEAVLKHYGITEADFEASVDVLEEWFMKTDLPKTDSDREKIKICLFNCKMSVEESKRSIVGYYKARALYSDFFDVMVPNTDEYNTIKGLVKHVVMPKLPPDLCRITIYKLSDPKGEVKDGMLYHLTAIMLCELRAKASDCFLSNILIVDLQDFDVKNLIKYTPSVIQKLISLLVMIKLRIKNIHFVNTPDIIDRIMIIVKNVLPSKFVSKVHCHQNPETLYKFIPKEYLPSNYKGDQPSIEDLYDEWCEVIDSYEEYFQTLLEAKMTGDAVAVIKEYEIPGIGCDGTFKKLTID